MPFPVSRSFSLALPGEMPAEPALGTVLRALSDAGAERIRMEADTGTFHVPWTVTYGPLWGVQRGDVQAVAGAAGATLRCRIALTRTAIGTAALVALWLATERWFFHPGWSQVALEGLAVWLYFWVIGYLWVTWRFRRFVRRAVSAGGAI